MKEQPVTTRFPRITSDSYFTGGRISLLIFTFSAWFIFLTACSDSAFSGIEREIVRDVRHATLEKADSFLNEPPVTVTAHRCPLSAGGLNDYWSPGDYWWPDPENPDGPYIRRDGETNPDFCYEHRLAIIRLSEITATLTSAWLLTGRKKYVEKVTEHLNAWFVDPATMMNPNMLYAQAIPGRVTGRGVGLIDAYHFVEVARSISLLSDKSAIPRDQEEKIKDWFSRFLTWMTTHEYGISEMNHKSNHGTCWVVTAAAFATLTGNQTVTDLCSDRIKTVLLPGLMADDGSFTNELGRTKPYGYSLFHMDAFANAARILSTTDNNLWEFSTPDGKSIRKGMDFIYPYIVNKESWPYNRDIYIWDEWPVRQSCLFFAGLAIENEDYLRTWLKLPAEGYHPEVIRNLPVRHPVIWLYSER